LKYEFLILKILEVRVSLLSSSLDLQLIKGWSSLWRFSYFRVFVAFFFRKTRVRSRSS